MTLFEMLILFYVLPVLVTIEGCLLYARFTGRKRPKDLTVEEWGMTIVLSMIYPLFWLFILFELWTEELDQCD